MEKQSSEVFTLRVKSALKAEVEAISHLLKVSQTEFWRMSAAEKCAEIRAQQKWAGDSPSGGEHGRENA